MPEAKPMVLVGQYYKHENTRNGGRITFDYGVDAIEVVNEIARFGSIKDMNFEIAVVFLRNKSTNPGPGEEDL